MHYHNIFLVNCKTKRDALELTKEFLEPYNENLEWGLYKEYATEQDIKRMAEHYKIDPEDLHALAKKMSDWDGMVGDVDEKGLFGWSDRNQKGEWDWYQWGGRWSWWDYDEEYEHVLFKPQTEEEKKRGSRTYWNSYHDPEVKGKKAIVTFPDGSQQAIEYGTPYPFQSWCNANPEHSDVIGATDPRFFEIIKKSRGSRADTIEWYNKCIKEYEEGKEDSSDMKPYYERKLKSIDERWTVDSYFWNITGGSFDYNREEIEKDPTHWFLVNVDLHT